MRKRALADLNSKRITLLIIDPQNDFIADGSLKVEGASEDMYKGSLTVEGAVKDMVRSSS